MKFQRSILEHVEGYVPGEQPSAPDVIKLNTNENPYPPSPQVLDALWQFTVDQVRKYPDPVSTRLRKVCADAAGFDNEDWVIAGNGMDELLALAVRTFVDPGDTVLSPYPTYVLYETLSKLHGATIRFIELDADFQVTDAFFTTPARLTFLPRPNSPSGVCVPKDVVKQICEASKGIVVIDEAYAAFADDNCLDFPKRFENAIVMRTFSKSHALAGLRLGIAYARPELIREFMKTKDSYNLNAATQAAGIAAMEDTAYVADTVRRVRATRDRLTSELRNLGFNVPASQANFLLAQWAGNPSAREIFLALKERSIFVRYFDAPRLQDALRITVGTDRQVDALLEALREILDKA